MPRLPHGPAKLLDLFKLAEREKTFVKTLSGGLAQRVQIARAIAHDPLRDRQADPLRERLQHVPGVTSVEGNATGLRVFTDGRTGLLPDIVEAAGDHLHDISVNETSLETVFIKLTGRELRD